MSKKIENEIFRILKESNETIQWFDLIRQSKFDSEEMSRGLNSLIDQKLIYSIGNGVLISKKFVRDYLLKIIYSYKDDIVNVPLIWADCPEEIVVLELESLGREERIEIREKCDRYYVVKRKKMN